MKNVFPFLLAMLLVVEACHSPSKPESDQEHQWPSDPQVSKKLHEWQDWKFGVIIHWGSYSEWGIVESWSLCP